MKTLLEMDSTTMYYEEDEEWIQNEIRAEERGRDEGGRQTRRREGRRSKRKEGKALRSWTW